MKTAVEIRTNPDGSVDEVICRKGVDFVHVEQMSPQNWWVRVDILGERAVVINFTTARAPIHILVERD